MKYNERELRLYGMENVGNVDQEGYLWKRGERSRDGYRKRWFVLKGNFLFYFRSHDRGLEPLGCIVLERVSVVNDRLEDNMQKFNFRLEFDSPDARVYFLSASSSETRKVWVEKIRQASFEHLRNTLLTLQKRLIELTGRNPLSESFCRSLTPDVAAPEPSRNLFHMSVGSASALEAQDSATATGRSGTVSSMADGEVDVSYVMLIECYGLPMMPGVKARKRVFPSTFVTVQRHEDSEWTPLGRTEIIEETTIPKFKDPVSLSQAEAQTTTHLRLQVYHQMPFFPEQGGAVSSLVQAFMGPMMSPHPPSADEEEVLARAITNAGDVDTATLVAAIRNSGIVASDASAAQGEQAGSSGAESDSKEAAATGAHAQRKTRRGFFGRRRSKASQISAGKPGPEEGGGGSTGSGTTQQSHPSSTGLDGDKAESKRMSSGSTESGGKEAATQQALTTLARLAMNGDTSDSSGAESSAPMELTQNPQPVRLSRDRDAEDDDGEEDDDDGDDISVASGLEFSDTNPFKGDLVPESMAMAEPGGPPPTLLGSVEITKEELLLACDEGQPIIAGVTYSSPTGESSDGAVRVHCRRTTVKFLKTPRMEDAPEQDDEEDDVEAGDDGEEEPIVARDPVSIIDEVHVDTFPMTQNVATGTINVQEIMRESPYFRAIPMQLLQRYVEEDRKHLEALDQVELVGPLQTVKRKLYDRVFLRHQRYQQHRAELDGFTSSFKPSRLKKNQNLEMIPTNLHSQLLRVEDHHGEVHTYETLTLGCPAAHSIGFKSGGLGAIKREMNEMRPRRALDVSRYKDKLAELAAGFAQWKEAVSAAGEDEEALKHALDGLGCMVQEMITLFKHKDIVKAQSQASRFRQVKPKLDICISEPKAFTTALDEAWATLKEAAKQEASTPLPDALRALVLCYESCYYELQECLYVVQIKQNEHTVDFPDIVLRQDVVFSQGLTMLVTGFISKLHQMYTDQIFVHQMIEIGFLFHVTSLLSTQGDEEDMLDDTWEACKALSNVKFTFSLVKGNKIDPQVLGTRNNITVDIGVSSKMLRALPEDLQHGTPVSVHTVLFTQGVNEMQTVANSLGNTDIQENINRKSFEQTERYSQSYCKFIKGRFPGTGDQRCALVLDQVEQLRQAMHSRKQKNIDLLFDSEKLARFMDAGRATMCKSGKDRSSMAVTLEDAFLLRDRHELPEDKISKVLSQMRAKGTRKKNVFKNISDYRYAFNRLQVMTLPKLLRPPEGTYGATIA